jgi:hypothetical protein
VIPNEYKRLEGKLVRGHDGKEYRVAAVVETLLGVVVIPEGQRNCMISVHGVTEIAEPKEAAPTT